MTTKQKGLRVKRVPMALSTSVLGHDIDATKLPEGHLTCGKCGRFRFEASMQGDNFRIELGCVECGEAFRLLLPLGVEIGKPNPWGSNAHVPTNGKFTCLKHPSKAMIVIHNVETVCIGCEACKTEIRIILPKEKGLVLPHGK